VRQLASVTAELREQQRILREQFDTHCRGNFPHGLFTDPVSRQHSRYNVPSCVYHPLPIPHEEESSNPPFILDDATKPFFIIRPMVVRNNSSPFCALFPCLRLVRVAASEAMCSLLHYQRVCLFYLFIYLFFWGQYLFHRQDELLGFDSPADIVLPEHHHRFAVVGNYLLVHSSRPVSDLVHIEPIFVAKNGFFVLLLQR
jgi:hypothetical protein